MGVFYILKSMTQLERLKFLIHLLLEEYKNPLLQKLPESEEELFQVYRSLVNVRQPQKAPEGFLEVQDAFLQEDLRKRGTVSLSNMESFENGIYLWRGDITRIACDAIVNAANSQMLGCFSPCHICIDNCIHTYAGIELRNACFRVIQEMGHEEETGDAKITPGFNLPAKFVLHTTGPIVHGILTPTQKALLASCYRNCLRVAEENGCQSIAFCCISTGVFGFPKDEACRIAIRTVKENKSPEANVIFNVFGEDDYLRYKQELS